MLHRKFRGLAVNAVDIENVGAIHRKINGPESSINCHNSFHGAALIATIANHAGNAGRHVIDNMSHLLNAAAAQKRERTCHTGTGSNSAAAECGQTTGILLDIHTNKVAQSRCTEEFFLRKTADLIHGIERHCGDNTVRSRAGDAHSRLVQANNARLDRSIAKKLGIPQLIIGLTIVAMGTSMPEAAVSITAGMNKNAGITIGNVVGSNILNILIILGVTALITNVALQKSTFLYEIPFMIVVTIVLMIFGITGSEVTFAEGVIFWILFLAYLGYLFVMARMGNDQEDGETKDYPIWKCILLMALGGILVVKGSDFAVSGASEIARYFGISERFIGLTIVALGTSLPELVTSVTAAKRGNAGIAIGNIVGSNIFNILFVIGTTALICTVPFESKFIIDTGIAILCGVILWLGTFRHKELRKPCGILMLLCYVAYFVYLCMV